MKKTDWPATIDAGTTLVITSGAYSDYRFDGPFRVVKPIDTDAVLADFEAAHPARLTEYGTIHPSISDFMAFLARAGYIEDMDAQEWDLGDYPDR